MGVKDKAKAFGKKFKLDSHHAIERSGIIFGTLALVGTLTLVTSGFSAALNGRGEIANTPLWTTEFETSRTELSGDVNGVYTNELGNKALVMMKFDDGSQISYNAEDYEAFLLGSNESMGTEAVKTEGVDGSFHIFGATGYVGVLLEADQAFDQQVLNLTMRANSELSFADQVDAGASQAETTGDDTFRDYDQWRIFFNPGANGIDHIDALESRSFDPARAYYEIVSKEQEDAAREELDTKLAQMRTNLTQINAYNEDLATTKVDGLFLRPPQVPSFVEGDEITGEPASGEDQPSTLTLETDHVTAGGFDLPWRAGNIYDGYLDSIVPEDESYIGFLSNKQDESGGKGEGEVSVAVDDMQWILSNGTDLANDYQSSDVTMRPLMNVMNNLSQAYQDYAKNKEEYQTDLMFELLELEIDLRDVQSNSSTRANDFMVVLY